MVAAVSGYNSVSTESEDTPLVIWGWVISSKEVNVQPKYEYKFVRLDQNKKGQGYQDVILEYAKDGWRLVQVFAPGAGGLWARESFCEVILERQVET